MFQLLIDIESNCSDYVIASYMHLLKEILNMIHIVVPILLMVMVGINFIQLMMDPEDQKKVKIHSLKNKCIAAVVVFFVPYIMNLLIYLISYSGLVSEDFNITECYKDSEIIYESTHK